MIHEARGIGDGAFLMEQGAGAQRACRGLNVVRARASLHALRALHGELLTRHLLP